MIDGEIEYPSGLGANATSVSLIPRGGQFVRGDGELSVPIVGAGHSFHFSSVPPGDYIAHVYGPPGDYVQDVRTYEGEWDGAYVAINEDNPSERISLILGSDGGAISGRLTAAGPYASGVLVVVSESSGEIYTATPDEDGRFSVPNLAPGTYRVFGWRDARDAPYRSPSFRSSFYAESKEVTVRQRELLVGVDIAPVDVQN